MRRHTSGFSGAGKTFWGLPRGLLRPARRITKSSCRRQAGVTYGVLSLNHRIGGRPFPHRPPQEHTLRSRVSDPSEFSQSEFSHPFDSPAGSSAPDSAPKRGRHQDPGKDALSQHPPPPPTQGPAPQPRTDPHRIRTNRSPPSGGRFVVCGGRFVVCGGRPGHGPGSGALGRRATGSGQSDHSDLAGRDTRPRSFAPFRGSG